MLQYMDVQLRKFEERDIPKKIEWINNPQNNQYLHYNIPLQEEKTLEWFRTKNNETRMDYTILYHDQLVGIIGLLQIDTVNLKAEYYITVGEESVKHCGVATKASKALIHYAFESLELHKLYLTVDVENLIARNLYTKLGFQLEGIFKDDLYSKSRGKYIDRARYALISPNH